MEDQKNFGLQNEVNTYNYYNQTDNNYEINQERSITNKAKEMIRTFKNQYLMNNNNNQRVIPTDINQPQQNFQSYQMVPNQNKIKDELNSYDYFFSSSRGMNRNITPTKKIISNEAEENNVDFVSQENAKLKKQLMDLVLENKNLQNKISNNYPSPIQIKDNNLSNINSINRQEQLFKEPENNMNINNINNMNNNLMGIPLNDKKFLEDSIESIIKTNMILGQNNNEIKKNINELKKYGNYKSSAQKSNNNFPQSNYNTNYNNFNFNPNENNSPNYNNFTNNLNFNTNTNNDKYLSLINDYNQLLEEFKSNRNKLENLQLELENKKGLSNKYRVLNNNYQELQNRNKDLVITIQKMKNDNTVLTHHIEDLNKKKKKFRK